MKPKAQTEGGLKPMRAQRMSISACKLEFAMGANVAIKNFCIATPPVQENNIPAGKIRGPA
jgi:hypothetical protein